MSELERESKTPKVLCLTLRSPSDSLPALIYYHCLTNLAQAPRNRKSRKFSDPGQALNRNLLNTLLSMGISVQYIAASTYPLIKNTRASLFFLTQNEQHYLEYVIEMGKGSSFVCACHRPNYTYNNPSREMRRPLS